MQGDGLSDSSYLPCHSFCDGRLTNQTKKNLLCALCVLKRPTEAGERKKSSFPRSMTWNISIAKGLWDELKWSGRTCSGWMALMGATCRMVRHFHPVTFFLLSPYLEAGLCTYLYPEGSPLFREIVPPPFDCCKWDRCWRWSQRCHHVPLSGWQLYRNCLRLRLPNWLPKEGNLILQSRWFQ